MNRNLAAAPVSRGDCIATRRDGAIGIVEFDNPDGGFLTAAMVRELDRVTLEWESDPSVRAVILTGRNKGTFITHYSPHELQAMSEMVKQCRTGREVEAMRRRARRALRVMQLLSRVAPVYRWFSERFGDGPLGDLLAVINFHRMLLRWQCSGTVYIAAINGYAMGGGCEIALACDFRLMSRGDHVLGLPESISGIIPGAGGTQRLARLIGPSRAASMIMRGEMSDADEAARKGLVDWAVDGAQLMEDALALAGRMAGQPPLSLAGVKRAIHRGIDLPMQQALELESAMFLNALVSRDAADVGADYMSRLNAGERPVDIFEDYAKGNIMPLRGSQVATVNLPR